MIEIRKYNEKDKKAVELIHFETGLLGKSMDEILTRLCETPSRNH